MEQPTLVKGKLNHNIYLFKGDDYWENLSTKVVARLKPEDAKRFFVIPLVLNNFAMRNPLLVDLIRDNGFIYDGLTNTTP